MIKRITKNKIVSLVVLAVIVFGIIAFVVNIAGNDKRELSSLNFKRGAINDQTGEYIETNTSLYTPEAIECKGLEIVPDFNAGVRYQIFWYNEDDLYFGCTSRTVNASDRFLNDVPSLAKYCRIVLYPYDENGRQSTEDIKFYNVTSIAEKVNVKVDRKQDYEASDIYDILASGSNKPSVPPETLSTGSWYLEGYHFLGYDDNSSPHTSYGSCTFTKNALHLSVLKVDCSSVKEYLFVYEKYEPGGTYFNQHVFFYSSNGSLINPVDEGIKVLTPQNSGGIYRVSVPEGASYMVVTVMDDINGFELKEYLPRNTITERLY